MAGSFGPGDAVAPGDKVMLRDEQAIALAIKGHRRQALDRLVVEIADAGVYREILQRADHLDGGLRQDGKIDLGMLRLEEAGEAGGHRQGRGNDAKRDAAADMALALELGDLLLESRPAVEDLVRPAQNPLPFGRQAEIALATLHDGNAELLFELANAPRQGRLADICKRPRHA